MKKESENDITAHVIYVGMMVLAGTGSSTTNLFLENASSHKILALPSLLPWHMMLKRQGRTQSISSLVAAKTNFLYVFLTKGILSGHGTNWQ